MKVAAKKKEIEVLANDKENLEFRIQELEVQQAELQENHDALSIEKQKSAADATKYHQELEGELCSTSS